MITVKYQQYLNITCKYVHTQNLPEKKREIERERLTPKTKSHMCILYATNNFIIHTFIENSAKKEALILIK